VDYRDADYRHIQGTYDEGSEAYGGRFSLPHESIEPERREFVRRLPRAARILDCGCGPGMDAGNFTSLGYRVIAIDLSQRFVTLAKARVPGAAVSRMDMRSLAFPPASFDGVWASFSLLHIHRTHIGQTLLGIKSVLRPGGLFFAVVHRGPATRWVKKVISGVERETYAQEWTRPEIEDAVRTAGFAILQSRACDRPGGRYPLLAIFAGV
jgi:SAM-dependent methyltransferase